MDWVRGKSIGSGSFSTVHLAIPRNSHAPLMAVKSCSLYYSAQLENEIAVLTQLQGSDNVIRCYEGDQTVENGEKLFNLLLEYAPGGSLSELVKSSGGVSESEIRGFTRSILKGLRYIHAKGFAHCDIKLQNLLLMEDGEVKIADFGLAKKSGEKQGKVEIRGTPLYMSPESVNENQYDSPCDIWALGIALIELITGKPAWSCKTDITAALLIRIGVGDGIPAIPQQFSDEGKDFISKCLVKNPELRWTADMLLNHPFVADESNSVAKESNVVANKSTVALKKSDKFSSPRCPFEFQEWNSIPSFSPKSELRTRREEESKINWSALACSTSPAERIRQLSGDRSLDWSYSDDWITIR